MVNATSGSSFLRVCCAAGGLLAFSWCLPGTADAQTPVERTNRGVVELIAGPDDTSIQIAQDLASVIDDGATRRVLPVVGRGSVQNLVDVRLLRGIDVGIVQTDVLEAAKKQKAYAGLESSLTYIATLYNEELHVLAPANIRDITELEGKRVNFVSSAAYTGPAVFDLLKISVEASSDDPVTALQKLKAGEIAASVYLAGKPTSFFGSFYEEGIHFLPVRLSPENQSGYLPAQLTAEDYPLLVSASAPVDTVAVGTVMVVAALQPKSDRYRNVANFVDAFFTQFPRLQDPGRHAKWQEVSLAADLPGWKRFPPAASWIQRNLIASAAPLKEQDLRDAFAKFLDERSRLAGGRALTDAEKNALFDLFLQWQKAQTP